MSDASIAKFNLWICKSYINGYYCVGVKVDLTFVMTFSSPPNKYTSIPQQPQFWSVLFPSRTICGFIPALSYPSRKWWHIPWKLLDPLTIWHVTPSTLIMIFIFLIVLYVKTRGIFLYNHKNFLNLTSNNFINKYTSTQSLFILLCEYITFQFIYMKFIYKHSPDNTRTYSIQKD
jgi:hypothetical protein